MSLAARDPRARLAEFVGYLREHGFPVGYAEVGLMLRATADLTYSSWPRLEARWRAIAAGNQAEWLQYPKLHQAFWFPHRTQGSTRVSGTLQRRRSIPELLEERRAVPDAEPPRPPAAGPGAAPLQSGGGTDPAEATAREEGGQGGASRTEAIEQRDFADWTQSDVERFELLVNAFERRLRRQLERRREADPARGMIDVRRTLRGTMSTAGELVRLWWVRRRRRPPRIRLVIDVSRSMELQSQFYLRLARVFVETMGARAFVFHTRLAEVTALMTRGSRRVQEKINAVTFGLGGGTRIATCLREWSRQDQARGVRRGDVLFICSDGYDTDEPALLGEVLAGIRAQGVRIVWLHPTRSIPASVAMAGAEASVNRFMPAHNLASLARLPRVLD